MKKDIITVVASVLATLIVLKIGILGIAIVVVLACIVYGLDQLNLFLELKAKIKDASAWKIVRDNHRQQQKRLRKKVNQDYRSIIDGSYYQKTPQDQSSQAAKKGGNSNE